MTIRELQQVRIRRFRSQQSNDPGWFLDVADVLNSLPPMSAFSFGNPNSNVSAIPGTMGFNLTSQATSKIWIKQVGSSDTGWASVLTSTVNEDIDLTGRLDASGQIRARGWYTTGAGHALEMGVSAGVGKIISYNRTAAAYQPFGLDASTILLTATAAPIILDGRVRHSLNSAPVSGTASGETGEIAWAMASGTTFLYICTSTNSWHRVALNPF